MGSTLTVVIDGATSGRVWVSAWGQGMYARRIVGMRRGDGIIRGIREAMRSGRGVILVGAPEYRGVTARRVVERGGRLYTRMPLEMEMPTINGQPVTRTLSSTDGLALLHVAGGRIWLDRIAPDLGRVADCGPIPSGRRPTAAALRQAANQ